MDLFIPVAIVGGIALLAGIMLAGASYFFRVKQDEKTEEIRKILPGANCGGCGYPGCDAYAEAVAQKGESPLKCAPGGGDTADKIREIIGSNGGEGAMEGPKVAFIKCSQDKRGLEPIMNYTGIPTCRSSAMFFGGIYLCSYGCLGFGDCMKACSFDAIKCVDGVMRVDPQKCTGCGTCVKACPKGIITLVSPENKYIVACSNKDKGAVAGKVCLNACIGCGKCMRICEGKAIAISSFLASIDPDRCLSCGKCIDVCVKSCIKTTGGK